MVKTTTSLITLQHTATADTPFRLTDASIPYYEVNIHIYDNKAYYGTAVEQVGEASVGAVISFQNGDLRDLYFKNFTAGSNCKIVAVATVPTDYVKAQLFEK
jgi:hypothetical protein